MHLRRPQQIPSCATNVVISATLGDRLCCQGRDSITARAMVYCFSSYTLLPGEFRIPLHQSLDGGSSNSPQAARFHENPTLKLTPCTQTVARQNAAAGCKAKGTPRAAR